MELSVFMAEEVRRSLGRVLAATLEASNPGTCATVCPSDDARPFAPHAGPFAAVAHGSVPDLDGQGRARASSAEAN
jgi:hypothetical protein